MSTQSAEHTVGSLKLVLCALAQKSITVEMAAIEASQPAQSNSSKPRTILTPTRVWLPPATPDAHSGKEQDVLQLAQVAHAAAHLLFSEPGRLTTGLKPMGVAVVSAFEDARVDRLLCEKYPGIRTWFALSITSYAQNPTSYFSSLIESFSKALVLGQAGQESYWVHKARTLFIEHERHYGLDDYDGFRRIASVMANDLGQMRVQFNPLQYVVPLAYHDDHSYLWNFEQTSAQPELSVATTPQSRRTRPLDGMPDQAHEPERMASSTTQSTFLYPEWNQRAHVLRQDWCTVIDDATASVPSDLGVASLTNVADRMPLRLRPLATHQALVQRGQWQGAELDMDALIDYEASQRLAGGADPRVFMGQRPRTSTLSILLLMDLSASTADTFGTAQTSILALQKKAAIDLARAAHARYDRVAIHGFSSNTRHAVSYQRFLEFEQPLSESALACLARARPAYSTRLGAALRHATVAAVQEKSERRVVIVLTDGAPSDIDVFDPDYLVADATRAVVEARRVGVQIYGVVLDDHAARHAEAVYGVRASQIIEHPEALPRYLSKLYRQLRH